MPERLAFNTRAYIREGSIGLPDDIAALALESADKRPLRDRITPFNLLVTPDGLVVNPQLGMIDVQEFYSAKTQVEEEEKKAGLKIRKILLEEDNGTVPVWISPSNKKLGYNESRITIGLNKTKVDKTGNPVKFMESYGLCTLYSSEQCLEIAKVLEQFSEGQSSLQDPEDLRGRVFVLRADPKDPWGLLKEIINLPEVWESIESGEAQDRKNKALKDAKVVAEKVQPLIQNAKTKEDFISAGAVAESMMMDMGWQMSSGPCGLLNSDFAMPYVYFQANLGIFGMVEKSNSESGKFVNKCGRCGVEINRVIEKGYQCPHCHGVYQGC